jgi:5-methylthioadenosine/S-adenosylhomocysteine deaminase
MKSNLHQPTKTFINAVIVTMNPKAGIIKNGYLTIYDKKITAIGEGEPETSENLIDAGGKILMPGFVNAHTHLPMTMYRGIADDLPLKEWLEEHIWPAEAKHTHEDSVRKATRLGLEEMVRTGTTTFSDMYFFADAVAEETEKFGLRGVMNEALVDFPTNSYQNSEEAFDKIIAFTERWKDNDLISPLLIFHATYTCSRNTILKVKELAEKYRLHITSHVSETQQEIENVKQAQGMNPVEYLDALDLISDKLFIAHGVWLNENDQNIFAKKGAHIVHCPSSNLKLGSGVAPIPDYLAKGINVALGTDGCASNNNLDMVEEMRLAALIHKGVNHNPTLIPAYEALKMATVNGAKALGLADKIGSLEVGKYADILVIDTQNTFMQPIYDYYSALVYAMNSSCIETVLVDGKVVMEDRKING